MKLGMIILTVVVVIGLGALLYAFPAGPTGKAFADGIVTFADSERASSSLVGPEVRSATDLTSGLNKLAPTQTQYNWCLQAVCTEADGSKTDWHWRPEELSVKYNGADIPLMFGYRAGANPFALTTTQRIAQQVGVGFCMRLNSNPLAAVCRVMDINQKPRDLLNCECTDENDPFNPPSDTPPTPPKTPPKKPTPECNEKNCPPLTICKRTPNGGWTPYVPSGTTTTATPSDETVAPGFPTVAVPPPNGR